VAVAEMATVVAALIWWNNFYGGAEAILDY
jgi:hypothetical protein